MRSYRMVRVLLMFCCVAMLFVAGCGSDDSTTAPILSQTNQSSAKGIWSGTTGTTAVSATVLSSGESWFVFQESGVTSRFAKIQLVISNNTYSGTGIRYNLVNGTSEPLTISGTFVEKSNLAVSLTAASGTSSYNLTYNSRYDTPAKLADAAGTWKGTFGNNTKELTLVFNNAGVLTSGSSSTGCSYSSTLQPRTADPAVFDLKLTETCQAATSTYSGIATVNEVATNLFFAFTNSSSGGLFVGQK